MKNKKISIFAAALISVAVPALAAGPGVKGAELSRQAHVTLARARQIALHARAGTVTDQELEREAGGSGLRYSFDIKSRGKTYEVGVDAATDAVLENAAEGPHPD